MELHLILTKSFIEIYKDGVLIHQVAKRLGISRRLAFYALHLDGLHVATISAVGEPPCAEGLAIYRTEAPFSFAGFADNSKHASQADLHLSFDADLAVDLAATERPFSHTRPFVICRKQGETTLTHHASGHARAVGFDNQFIIQPQGEALVILPFHTQTWVPLGRLPFTLETTETGVKLQLTT